MSATAARSRPPASDPRRWGIEVLSRTSAPPLRVSARRLFDHTCRRPGGPEMSLSLFALRHGGFAVSWCEPGGAQGAARSEDLDDAMAVIEALCRDLSAAQFDLDLGLGGMEGIVGALSQLHRKQTDNEAFLALAGRALDDWDSWKRTGAPENGTGG